MKRQPPAPTGGKPVQLSDAASAVDVVLHPFSDEHKNAIERLLSVVFEDDPATGSYYHFGNSTAADDGYHCSTLVALDKQALVGFAACGPTGFIRTPYMWVSSCILNIEGVVLDLNFTGSSESYQSIVGHFHCKRRRGVIMTLPSRSSIIMDFTRTSARTCLSLNSQFSVRMRWQTKT
jgi:hypothetical protein